MQMPADLFISSKGPLLIGKHREDVKKRRRKKSSGKLFTTSKDTPDQIPIISRPAKKLDEGDGWGEEQGGGRENTCMHKYRPALHHEEASAAGRRLL